MTKRWTDTEKWGKRWLRQLDGKYRAFWLYICDRCDLAGIWDVDFEVASIHVGFEFTEAETLKALSEKVVVIDGGRKWFIPSFVSYQQGEVLNLTNNCHLHIIRILYKQKLFEFLNQHTKEGSIKIGKLLQRPSEGLPKVSEDLPKTLGGSSDGPPGPISKSKSKSKALMSFNALKSVNNTIKETVTPDQGEVVKPLIDYCAVTPRFGKVMTKSPDVFFVKMMTAYNLSPARILKELKKMDAWLESNPKRIVRDPKRFINNWLGRAGEDSGEGREDGSDGSEKPKKPGKYDDVPVTTVNV